MLPGQEPDGQLDLDREMFSVVSFRVDAAVRGDRGGDAVPAFALLRSIMKLMPASW